SEDVIEVEDTVESEDETVPASVHEVGKSSTSPFLREDSDGLLPGLMRRDVNSLFGLMASLSRRLVEEGTSAMENLVKKLSNAEEKAECKKLKKEPEEARSSNTLLRMQNKRVKRYLYWTRVRAHEFYREMIRRDLCLKKDRMSVVEPNQHNDILVVSDPVLVDEDEDPKEEEFEKEEEPQEEDDDIEVDIEEDDNEPELTYPYKEVDPFNPLPPTSESESEDVIEVEDTVESEDETVP
nr:hypothetical protein [Tanacetum cinerariifolium]